MSPRTHDDRRVLDHQATLLADLERQRDRLAALAVWLLEQGLAGEAAAARNIAVAIASDVAALAA